MPGAGTDKSREWPSHGGPAIILVEPQMGENIGAAARAMGNFGLTDLRLVRPRDGWPNQQAVRSASGADRVLENVRVFDSTKAAIADCTLLLATTAREHGQQKTIIDAEEAARRMQPRIAAGETVGILFGRERTGLENYEVSLADCVVTLPVNPAFSSLNLAQAVLILAYEWFKLASGGALPFETQHKAGPAPKEHLLAFFDSLERELERVDFFRPPEKRETMTINLRNLFHRLEPTLQDVQTLQGIIRVIAEGRKGLSRGGVLDSAGAESLRELIAEHNAGRVPRERAPVRGLARLLRRNASDAERLLWKRMVNDRRFAGRGFKRQVPVGPYIADFVSFPLRTVIDFLPAQESEAAAQGRKDKRAWFAGRNYRVIELRADEVEADVQRALDRLDEMLAEAAKASSSGRPPS
ncbi:MAG: TrmJ/YjtD family RNA methyltransferase [Bradyrhizobiaceae bacterium]|nr:TrmJ/YjtD family RNA methyltransferase [Bradyrhizobiaceae bacterium]